MTVSNKEAASQLRQKAVDIDYIRNLFTGEYELDLYKKYEDDDEIIVGPNQQSKYDVVEDEMHAWVEEYCDSYVLFEGDMRFSFLSETDRTTFKLVWG